jgi:streptogramin lyase
MRRALRLVIRCIPAAATFGGSVSAVLAVAALTALGSPHTAWSAGSSRGLHVISADLVDPELVLDSDGTPWFIDEFDLVVHVTADGRVVRYHVPRSSDLGPAAWGADGALWVVDVAIRGLIRVAPDGRETRLRDVWATQRTDTAPCCMIAGPDGRLWLDYDNRILSVAADSPARVIATVDRQYEPVLLVTGPDGSVWFSLVSDEFTGLQRVLPDGHLDAMRYRTSDIESASVSPSGDVWFLRSIVDDFIAKRTYVVRIDRAGRVTEFRAPRVTPAQITAAADGTVWIAGGTKNSGNREALYRMDQTGRFERIFRAQGWDVDQMRAAPDGRLWLTFGGFEEDAAAWLPPNPCRSRRRITVYPRQHRGDPIRSVRLSVQGRLPRTFHGRQPSIPIDLRGYLPGAVGVSLKIRTAHHRRTRHLVFHTCRFPG